ncbi:MAG: hypothetical protein EZS26_000970 [Candidatus Ordinivivax streblomastigis]|uniref:DUF3310 domain-containing protein n=1 Tax=Candidatus Ordinivivax streblomastigis TaxID=2540710 RepID=A0A5M8P3G9_9BACT|nr:MAG: hypothetical protein EZS26_000970 [Candidatus Ordinivivax streblomastigis]
MAIIKKILFIWTIKITTTLIPLHYRNYSFVMITIYGEAVTAQYCEMTAFKYRMRMGTKPGNSIEQDLAKEKWYLNKAKELRQI